MKRKLGLFLSMAMLLGSVPAMAEEEAQLLSKDLMILFTSDVHCGIEQGFGYAGLAAVRDQLAEENYVMLVDNGDAIQGEPVGTMTTGEAIVNLMDEVGYESVTMGNHEFDYGMERFLELAEAREVPYISCNFTYNGELVFDPYVIKEFDGVKIAFVGVTTPKTFTSSTPTYFQDENGNYVYGFCEGNDGQDLYDAVQKAVDSAREEGAEFVILQAHLGIEEECSPWMSTDVIANTIGLTAVLDGHSHSELEQEEVIDKDGHPVQLVAAGTKMENIGYLKIAADGSVSTGLYSWKNDISFPAFLGETEVSKAVDEATAALNEKLNEVVASSEVDLTIYDAVETDVRIIRNAETNLGDLCADAYRAMSGADVAFVNGGGIRVSIEKGDITLDDILKVHPFGNALCLVECTGQQILDALEWGAHVLPDENGGFLQVSGLTYEIHPYIESSCTCDDKGAFTGVEGEYRVKNVMVGGEPLDLEKTYKLASHNYMLKNGGDGFTMFQECNILIDESMLDNQVLINYITDSLGGVVGEAYADPYGDGRIVAVEEAPAE
ncbi:MAG: bifunctional metallophosphatase/5'-nucleotidase [Blautia sp.]|nr:bifunctional metallophosphatase/5'-nucleotidase [Blautia sp.]